MGRSLLTRRQALTRGAGLGLGGLGLGGASLLSGCGPHGGVRTSSQADPEALAGDNQDELQAEDVPAEGAVDLGPAPGRKQLKAIQAGWLHLGHVNTRESLAVQLMVPDMDSIDGWRVNPEAKQPMYQFLRDWRHDVVVPYPDRLLHYVHSVARYFEARLLVVSGYRSKSRKTSRHRQGRAIDLRVEGVNPKEVWGFIKTLPKVGAGWYPTSRFCHLDVRDRSYFWIDDSGPGQRSRYRKGVPQPPRSHDKRELPGEA